jgi:hypothetical protein
MLDCVEFDLSLEEALREPAANPPVFLPEMSEK